MTEVYVYYGARAYGVSLLEDRCSVCTLITGAGPSDRAHITIAPHTPSLSGASLEGTGFARVDRATISLSIRSAEVLAHDLLRAIQEARRASGGLKLE